jgi:hemolysin activation/secretion protein
MLTQIAVILIHSTLCSEIAQGAPPAQSERPFSLRGGKTIVVQKFEFEGNSGITTAQLERLTNHYLNRTLSESNLSEIKLRIEILYRSKGYSNVEVAIAPSQKDDTLTFIIKEGKKQS